MRTHDREREDAFEERRFLPGEVHARFPAERFADDERSGEGQHAGCEQTCCNESDGKERFSVRARKGSERHSGIGGTFDFDALREEHCTRGYDDEPRDDAGNHCARDRIDALEEEILYGHALLDHVALCEEHHPGRDGGTDHGQP